MAWEMQTHMRQYIRPSINKWMNSNLDKAYEVCEDYGVGHLPQDIQVSFLAELSEKYRTTTNGGKRFYLSEDWNITIEWCSEEEMLAYQG